MTHRLFSLLALAVVLAAPASGQQIVLAPDLSLVLNGGIQPRVSVGVEDGAGADATRYGAGLRRARIQARVLYRDIAGVEYDVDAGTGTVQSVDIFAFANVTPSVQMRLGYFPIAQPRSGVLTPYFLIDAVDRAAIAERWLVGTLGADGRDLGADVTYLDDRVFASVAVHNGDGTFANVGNVRQGISSPDVTGGVETQGLAVSAAVAYQAGAGVQVGGFASANGANPDRTARAAGGRDYTSGGVHAYWGTVPGSQPVRVKLDALALRYADDGAGAQESAGVSLLGAVGVLGAAEVFARAERYWSDVDRAGDDYLSAGLSYSVSAARGDPFDRARLTLAYQYRGGGDVLQDAHLAILQGQLSF